MTPYIKYLLDDQHSKPGKQVGSTIKQLSVVRFFSFSSCPLTRANTRSSPNFFWKGQSFYRLFTVDFSMPDFPAVWGVSG